MITDNLRRLAGVNAAAEGGKWEPAAEILSLRFVRAKDLNAISVQRINATSGAKARSERATWRHG